ncbi:MAG: hypothetical protein J6K77_07440 [Ruminococcus sp.]|nr:hypothetical protein [Ruminococcus sp.]
MRDHTNTEKYRKLNRFLSLLGNETVSWIRIPIEEILPKVTDAEIDRYLMILLRSKPKRDNVPAI